MQETFLFTDTEVTGWRKSGPKIQEGQGRVCQLAAILTDDIGNSIIELSLYVKPDGWKISDGARECHSITDEHCELFGVDQQVMMFHFRHLAERATQIVAHNCEFDKAMLDIENAYYMKNEEPCTRKPWYCTQQNAVDLCKIPPTEKMKKAGRYHYKSPTLAEAYQILCGKRLEGAHNALHDVRACRDIFFKMRGVELAA